MKVKQDYEFWVAENWIDSEKPIYVTWMNRYEFYNLFIITLSILMWFIYDNASKLLTPLLLYAQTSLSLSLLSFHIKTTLLLLSLFSTQRILLNQIEVT